MIEPDLPDDPVLDSDRFPNTEALGADRGYQRLEHLYEISKCLANFETIERTLSEILKLVASTLSIRSAILIEKRPDAPGTIVWQVAELSDGQIRQMVEKARDTFGYMLNLTPSQRAALQSDTYVKFTIAEERNANSGERSSRDNQVAFPLTLDRAHIFGVLQFDLLLRPNEQDLRFANALTNLISVALSRHYFQERDRNGLLYAGAIARDERDDSRRIVKELEEERTKLALSQKKIDLGVQEIAAERAKLDAMFRVSPSGIGLMRGPSLVFEKVNEKFTEFASARVYVGRTWEEVYEDYPKSKMPTHLKDVFESGQTHSVREIKVRKSSGQDGFEDQFYDYDFYRIMDSDGGPYGVVIQCSNVTDRVNSRLKLEESEALLIRNKERLAISIAISKVGFYERDIVNDNIICSDQMLTDWGLAPGGGLENILARIHPEDREQTRLQISETLQNRKPFRSEYRVIRPDGTIVWIEARGEASYDPEGNPIRFLGTSRDISSQKQLLQELEEAKRDSDRANSAKSAFLANMSHEIRTPLGAIMGFVDLLKEPSLPRDTALSYVEVIDRNAHHLMRIVDDVLDLTKVEAGKITIEKIEFSLVDLMNDFSTFMKLKAHENGIHLNFKAGGHLPIHVISDPTRIRQILANIVGNAIKFTDHGEVTLLASYDHQRLSFRVTDSGRGISSEQQELLFRPFTQADSSTTRKYGGSGLGLFLTKKLSQAMGGDFSLTESELGKGSTFEASVSLELPANAQFLSAEKFTTIRKVNSNVKSPVVELNDFNILLVEDSLDNQMLFRQMLKSTGANLTIANDGVEGVEAAALHEYDIILMDIQMPRMDGHEAVATLRGRGFSGPIVALTAHAMKEERTRALESGFSHFLSKPIDRLGLIDLLAQIYCQQKLVTSQLLAKDNQKLVPS